MARALRLAERGLYTTHPNPRVGCVLVKNDRVIGEGWHRRAGEPHAERLALAAAGEAARGATAYVTLEPCCHHGRTPPCTDALIESGVTRLVAAMEDPNPRVAGQGFQRLREAGIEVHGGVLQAQAEALNPGFIKRIREGLPYLRVKLAMSMDGRTAMASGESQWISSEASRRNVQRLRARSSAILTGIGTVLADDPSMNVRLDPGDLAGMEEGDTVYQPVRVVLDARLNMPAESRMLTLPGQTVVLCADEDPVHAARLEAAGAHVVPLPGDERGVDLRAALEYLAEQEVNEVLLEAGATLAGSALQSSLVDEIWLYMAPHLMGDAARGLFHLPGLERMAQRIPLEIADLRRIGPDVRFILRPLRQTEIAE
ncbi:MAG TPA: bifunctional diaminohydroxyphosphoribosylaminopyrimidine deaminase/5-amino-6-(5-phosphoribosylamino)uracil reductase RibD [Chromatiales bacterium]|nr:bifunctional diaminohydroxyphosphoribosylaminopyrimidine deaminase/5-amino-6-(5-phosphoribosylamino)uracil reductase RibD [Chromatiales bacterium]